MKLEVGKRYVMRNGEVTGLLERCEGLRGWFKDSRNTWREDGMWSSADVTGDYDIVAEYVEPQPQQPLKWVECKPDKPGIWLRMDEKSITGYVVDAGDLQGDDAFDWEIATRCYLGPIPEILPPKKKVVERLWLEAMANGIEPQTVLYRMHWCVDDNAKAYPINWIRTDNTREREV